MRRREPDIKLHMEHSNFPYSEMACPTYLPEKQSNIFNNTRPTNKNAKIHRNGRWPKYFSRLGDVVGLGVEINYEVLTLITLCSHFKKKQLNCSSS